MSAPGARSQTPKVASVVKTEASSGIDFDAEVWPTSAPRRVIEPTCFTATCAPLASAVRPPSYPTQTALQFPATPGTDEPSSASTQETAGAACRSFSRSTLMNRNAATPRCEMFSRMSRASLPKPFRVSSLWSASPPSQHRFTGRADRDNLRCIGPSSDTCCRP